MEQVDRAAKYVSEGDIQVQRLIARDVHIARFADTVQIDASNLTEEDLRLLRNARVVDLRTVSGRPLTETEAMQFTARMISAKKYTGARPLLLPPDEYFTVSAQGNTLVCLAKNGDLVSITDPACPDEIRRALQNQ